MSVYSLTDEQARRIVALAEAGWEALVQVHPPRDGFLEHAVDVWAQAIGRVTGEARPLANLSAADRQFLMRVADEMDGERGAGLDGAIA